MAIYTFPTDWYNFTAASFYLQSRSQTSGRPWLGGKSVYGPHAQLWIAKLTMTEQDWSTGQAVSAFFSRLDGQAGLMRIGHVARITPQLNREIALTSERWSDNTLYDDGTGFVSGGLPATAYLTTAAVRGDNYIVIGGLPVSTTRAIRRGDLVEIRVGGIETETPHLYECQFDAPTNASGHTGIEIRPRLRANVAAGDMVVLNYPTSVFRVVDDDQGAAEITPPYITTMGFTLIEAIV